MSFGRCARCIAGAPTDSSPLVSSFDCQCPVSLFKSLAWKSEQPTASDTPGDASDCDIYQSVLSVLCQILYYLSLQSIIRVKTLSWAWNWVRRSGRGGAADRIGYSSLSTGDDYRDFFKVYRSRTLHEACEA